VAASSAGRSPDSLAGLRILDTAAAAIVSELGAPTLEAVSDGDALVAAARERFEASLAGDDIFARMVRRTELDQLPAEVLALACAVELDSRRQRLVAFLQDDVTKPRLTLQLVALLWGEAGVRAIGEDEGLRRCALVQVKREGPWSTHQVVVPEAVTWALAGDTSIDTALGPAFELLPVPLDHPDRRPAPLSVVAGPDRTRRLQAGVLASASELVLVVEANEDPERWEALVRFATIHGVGVLVEAGEDLPGVGRRWIERADHVSWCIASRTELPVSSLPARPWRELQPHAALATSEEIDAVTAGGLGTGHRLTAEQLHQLDRLVPVLEGDITAAIRRLGAGPLEHLARRVRPRRARGDLILLDDQEAQLDELISRYRDRDVVYEQWGIPAVPSAGVVAMFSGPSGTGKTTAAEIVANALELDLFVVDISSVVSKYIGETEKNLERIFDAAAAGNHVILFDEADALFGKRTEISDARDRYANVEVSYLLQRLETFDGLLVLTTNLQRNIDQAFLRRVHVAIEFPLPHHPERLRIWQHWLGLGAPVGKVDVDHFAKHFELSGGSIANTVLTSTFLAASRRTSISNELVALALKRELHKQGRLCTEADFGPYYQLVAGG
jgi:hypothetical protein